MTAIQPLQTSYTPYTSRTSVEELYLQVTFSHDLFGGQPLIVDGAEVDLEDFSFKLSQDLSHFCAKKHIGGTHRGTLKADCEVEIFEGTPDTVLPADPQMILKLLEKEVEKHRNDPSSKFYSLVRRLHS